MVLTINVLYYVIGEILDFWEKRMFLEIFGKFHCLVFICNFIVLSLTIFSAVLGHWYRGWDKKFSSHTVSSTQFFQ